MKKLKTLSCLVLIVFLLASFSTTVLAETLPTYKVTVSGGLYGKVNGQPEVSSTYNYGDTFVQGNYTVEIDSSKDPDGKYYFKGFHISGQDTPFLNGTAITKDIVLVASFGVKGEMIDYTVHYLNLDGTRLFEDDILSGKADEEQIVPARHINGYTPNTYNFRFRLVSPREVSFYYTPVQGTPVGGNNNNNNNNQNNDPNATPNPDDPNATPSPSQTPAPEVSPEPTPAIIIDVPDDPPPLVNPDPNMIKFGPISLPKSTWTAIGISLVGLLGIAAFILYLITHRKKS